MHTSFSKLFIFLFVCLTAELASAQPALKDVFKNRFVIGAALNEAQFTERDSTEAAIIKAQFNTITPENVLKWELVHPQPGVYKFDAPDKYVEFGMKNNMVIIGHNLVWHSQTPKWVFQDSTGKPISKENLLARMHDHILTVVGRYKGKITGWDVVNEAVNDDGSLRQSPWMKIIGEEYLLKAFEYAHEADPQTELYYNDYSVENIPKRNGVIALVKKLQAAGIPVAGIGMQGHYSLIWPTLGQVDSTINEFAALGVKVLVTELDIDVLPQQHWSSSADVSRKAEYKAKFDPYKTGLPDSVQQALAKRYGELFGVFVKDSDKLKRVTLWGVTDAESWLNGSPVPYRTNYPLLFGRDGKPKPAFDAVIKSGL
jgi:endo-1,4-beta-xylanase